MDAGEDDRLWLYRLLPLTHIGLRVQVVGLASIFLAKVLEVQVLLGGVHQERAQEDLERAQHELLLHRSVLIETTCRCLLSVTMRPVAALATMLSHGSWGTGSRVMISSSLASATGLVRLLVIVMAVVAGISRGYR